MIVLPVPDPGPDVTPAAHEVIVSRAAIAATCTCGWTSAAVDDHAAKITQGSAHMWTWHAVFVETTEDDGTTVMCWGTT